MTDQNVNSTPTEQKVKRPRVVITDAQKAAAAAAYTNGQKTQGEIAHELGVSLPTISKLLKGVAKPVKRKYPSHATNADRDREIVRLFTEEKQTLRAIAGKVGCTHQNISLILKKAGVDPGAVLAEKHAQRTAVTAQAQVQAREARAAARDQKVRLLSDLWKAGASVEDIRVAGGLKSIGAANVKIVLLRKKHPDLFPLRGYAKKARAAAPAAETAPAETGSPDEVTFGG